MAERVDPNSLCPSGPDGCLNLSRPNTYDQDEGTQTGIYPTLPTDTKEVADDENYDDYMMDQAGVFTSTGLVPPTVNDLRAGGTNLYLHLIDTNDKILLFSAPIISSREWEQASWPEIFRTSQILELTPFGEVISELLQPLSDEDVLDSLCWLEFAWRAYPHAEDKREYIKDLCLTIKSVFRLTDWVIDEVIINIMLNPGILPLAPFFILMEAGGYINDNVMFLFDDGSVLWENLKIAMIRSKNQNTKLSFLMIKGDFPRKLNIKTLSEIISLERHPPRTFSTPLHLINVDPNTPKTWTSKCLRNYMNIHIDKLQRTGIPSPQDILDKDGNFIYDNKSIPFPTSKSTQEYMRDIISDRICRIFNPSWIQAIMASKGISADVPIDTLRSVLYVDYMSMYAPYANEIELDDIHVGFAGLVLECSNRIKEEKKRRQIDPTEPPTAEDEAVINACILNDILKHLADIRHILKSREASFASSNNPQKVLVGQPGPSTIPLTTTPSAPCETSNTGGQKNFFELMKQIQLAEEQKKQKGG